MDWLQTPPPPPLLVALYYDQPLSTAPPAPLRVTMLSVDFNSLSKQGALIFPEGGWLRGGRGWVLGPGAGSPSASGSVLEETALSWVAPLALGPARCRAPLGLGSSAGEQMGDVWSHFRLVAECAPGAAASLACRALLFEGWAQSDAGIEAEMEGAMPTGEICGGTDRLACVIQSGTDS